MSSKVTPISTKLMGEAQRTTGTRLEIMEITPPLLESWKPAPFQRPLRVNAKVLGLVPEIKRDGVLPGIITLGVLNGGIYVLDGQHRLHAFKLTESDSVYADVRIHHFATVGEMGEEFVRLNSQLVTLRPDDILRGLEGSLLTLANIRKACPWIGYDMIRRSEKSPVLSMAVAVRTWRGSETDVPSSSPGSAQQLALTLLDQEADAMVGFLQTVFRAWGRDHENARLWSHLNLTLCAWLYRRTVLAQHSPATTRLTKPLYEKCAMSLSADGHYVDWLLGRNLCERDRSPAYQRIRNIFAARIQTETGQKPKLPSPAWYSHTPGRRPASTPR